MGIIEKNDEQINWKVRKIRNGENDYETKKSLDDCIYLFFIKYYFLNTVISH